MRIQRIGILTGGGDCPGLNAVIRAVVLDAAGAGIEVIGISDGFLGLIEDRARPIRPDEVSEIVALGGTILGTSNKANPSRFAACADAAGKPVFSNVMDKCLEHVRRHRLDALLVIGGDGTMTVAEPFAKAGLNCIGIPKTIDNDLWGTDLTFGFLTASSIAAEALDRLHTTAASHHRALVMEVMGRNSGWIALHAGVASGCHVILIPEVKFSIEAVARAVMDRRSRGKTSSLICVAEGASTVGGEQSVMRIDPTSPDPIRLGGIAQTVAAGVEAATGIESRYVVLGHIQRGGSPIPADRVMGTRFGHAAMEALRNGLRNRMVAWQAGRMTDIELSAAAGKQRKIEPDNPLVAAARAVGTRFGDE